MISPNMQEAREILSKLNWYEELVNTDHAPDYYKDVEILALALQKAEARGRLAGVREGLDVINKVRNS